MKSRLKNLFTVSNFTLIEVLVSMAVFSIIMFAIISLFSSAQKSWTYSGDMATMYADAKIALDLITNDLQCAYYGDNVAPFWQKDDSYIAFISATPVPHSPDATSPLFEITYTKENDSNNISWLKRSAIGNDLTAWNWQNATSTSCFNDADLKQVIPYVTELTFECYDKDGNIIDPDSENLTDFPYAVNITISLLGKNAWQKWKQSNNEVIKNINQRTFTKTVILGERGQ